MDDSFKVRVDKVFGSLVHLIPHSMEAPWSISDEDVERRRWNREKGSPDREDVSSSFPGYFSNETEDLITNAGDLLKEIEDDFDDVDDECQSSRQRLSEADKEEREIRSSIGLDCTLDNEDEEDEYDKLAVGMEHSGERIYMGDVTNYGSHIHSENLHNTLRLKVRDQPANHLAVTARSMEDTAEAEMVDSCGTCEPVMSVSRESICKISEMAGDVKSILKRKRNPTDSRLKKRVRFNSEIKAVDSDRETATEFDEFAATPEKGVCVPDIENPNFVPDHVRNPQNYTHYTFDSVNEEGDESNMQAYRNFHDSLNASVPMSPVQLCSQTLSQADITQPIIFTPRVKTKILTTADDSRLENLNILGVAAGAQQESDICDTEEDKMEVSLSYTDRPERHYRSKASLDN